MRKVGRNPSKQMPVATTIPIARGGIKSYYQAKIESAEILINQKTTQICGVWKFNEMHLMHEASIPKTEVELIL